MFAKRFGFWLGLVLFVGVLFWPVPQMSHRARCAAATALLMACWWISETLPLPVTALVPLVAFPCLGVMSGRDVAPRYADKNVILFMGGFFIAMGMQRWDLHKRIGLHIINKIGKDPRLLVLGFMIATCLLSMWISNTSTTMMMTPIALAVIAQFEAINVASLKAGAQSNPNVESASMDCGLPVALMLGTAYAANIGGIGTKIGTPPNLLFASAYEKLLPEAGEISFLQWMLIGLPLVAVFLPIVWLYLVRIASPVRETPRSSESKAVIQRELNKLGEMSKGERYVLIIAGATALLWIFRRDVNLGFVTLYGWTTLLGWLLTQLHEFWPTFPLDAAGIGKQIDDSTVAILGALAMFIVPVDRKRGEFVLNWEWAVKIPWGIILLIGGGVALASGFKESGLSAWIGERFHSFRGLPPICLIASVCLIVTFLTEITSNTATTAVLMPILASTSDVLGVDPLLLMLPATISASCAFMLPVATPPNAIVFGSGRIPMKKMVRTGIVMNLIGVMLVTALVYFVAAPVFGISVR